MKFAPLVLALLVLGPVALASVPRSDSMPYTWQGSTQASFNCGDSLMITGFQTEVCFRLDGSERNVRLTIADVVPLKASGYYAFLNAQGSYLGPDGPFCGATSTMPIPAGAGSVVVALWGLPGQSALFGCQTSGTTGNFVAAFT